MTPLRQRMLHDMLMRGLGPHSQRDYICHVRRLAAFLGRSPDTARAEDLRRFQLYQHENGVSPATINGAVSALRFLFAVTLKRRDKTEARSTTCKESGCDPWAPLRLSPQNNRRGCDAKNSNLYAQNDSVLLSEYAQLRFVHIVDYA